MSSKLTVFLSSLKMAIATFMSRILGLVREQVIAFYFGASGITDAFLIAYRIPNLLRDLFAEGAFSAAFVPSFVDANLRNKEEARKLLWSLFIFLLIVTSAFTGLVWYFTEEIVNFMAPTFYKDPFKFRATVSMTKAMAPFLMFVSIAALFMGALNSLKIFFVPSLAPAFFNITMILSIIVIPSLSFMSFQTARAPYIALALGVFLGGLVQALVQIPLIIKHGYAPKWPGKILSTEVKKVLAKLGPGLIGFAATQINLVINTILASSAVVGAVSWLGFAFRLFQFPVGILSVSIGNSNLVHFSNAWKKNEKEKAIGFLESSYFLSFFLVLPAMVALLTCADEMINIIFEHGKFTADSTAMTAKALRLYAIGLPMYSIYKIFVPTFYAIDRQKIPVYCSIFGIAFNIIFCISLIDDFGFEVLALGTTLSMLLNTFAQAVILKGDLKLRVSTFISLRLIKIVIAALFSAACVIYVKQLVNFVDQSFVMRCTYLAVYLAIIALCYFTLCVIFGERALLSKIIRRFK